MRKVSSLEGLSPQSLWRCAETRRGLRFNTRTTGRADYFEPRQRPGLPRKVRLGAVYHQCFRALQGDRSSYSLANDFESELVEITTRNAWTFRWKESLQERGRKCLTTADLVEVQTYSWTSILSSYRKNSFRFDRIHQHPQTMKGIEKIRKRIQNMIQTYSLYYVNECKTMLKH